LILGLEPARAVEAMTCAMGSSCDVSGAAHLPAGGAGRIAADELGGGAGTALRVEGVLPPVAARQSTRQARMKGFGGVATAEAPRSRAFWKAVRDVPPFAAGRSNLSPPQDERPLWRISTAPSRGAELGAMIAKGAQAQMFYDWAGGLIWVAFGGSDDA